VNITLSEKEAATVAGLLLGLVFKGVPDSLKIISGSLLVHGTNEQIRERAERLILTLKSVEHVATGEELLDLQFAAEALETYLKIIEAHGGPITDQAWVLAE
jgi:hypothetical protein